MLLKEGVHYIVPSNHRINVDQYVCKLKIFEKISLSLINAVLSLREKVRMTEYHE